MVGLSLGVVFISAGKVLKPSRDASIGIEVKATNSEANRANVTVSAWSENRAPAIPSTNTKGTNTARVVSVEAKIAPATSFVPVTAASNLLMPSLRQRSMFSNTTMALSTNRPMASAIPPNDMMFKLISAKYIMLKVAITEKGIEMEIISVGMMLRRNR